MGVIEFKDKGFEKAVKKALNISEEKVTAEDLLSIVGILVSYGEMCMIPIPWGAESSVFNMIFPNLEFNIQDSANGQWESDLVHFSHIQSLFLYVENEDLGFLQRFSLLKELYVMYRKQQTGYS